MCLGQVDGVGKFLIFFFQKYFFYPKCQNTVFANLSKIPLLIMYVFQFSVYDKNNSHKTLPNARVAPFLQRSSETKKDNTLESVTKEEHRIKIQKIQNI